MSPALATSECHQQYVKKENATTTPFIFLTWQDVTIWHINNFYTKSANLSLFARSKMPNSVEMWATSISWSSWLTALGQFFPDFWVIPIAFDSSQILLPLMNVRISAKVTAGTNGSCWDLGPSFVSFFEYLVISFGRCANQDLSIVFFSRAFRALMPSIDRNEVTDTVIIATAPSTWVQKNNHTMSKL